MCVVDGKDDDVGVDEREKNLFLGGWVRASVRWVGGIQR